MLASKSPMKNDHFRTFHKRKSQQLNKLLTQIDSKMRKKTFKTKAEGENRNKSNTFERLKSPQK